MLSKAMRFATVCTLAFAICGKASRDKSEEPEYRSGQETNFEDQLSTTVRVSSIPMRKPTSGTTSSSVVRRLAAILALSSRLTSADAFASPGVHTAFAPSHTNKPLHGTPAGPLHASIGPFDLSDPTVQGAGIAISGLATGFGLLRFIDETGEKGKVSDELATLMAGKLMEDIENENVKDLGGLTAQLENALKESSPDLKDELELTEEDKAKIAADLDDGW